jgi:hypothetical protein
MNPRDIIGTVATALVLAASAPADAQQPIAYPAKGQSPPQQQRDRGECDAWAKQTTGIDPAVVAQTPVPQPQGGPAVGGGERVRGAARGAAGGAAIGAIAGDDAGKGAAAGAVVGTMAGGARARRNKAAQEQQAQAQGEANKQAAIGNYNRAFAACMEARGYTIK